MKIMPYHTINLAKPVDIYLAEGIASDLNEIIKLRTDSRNIMIITDSNVYSLHAVRLIDSLKGFNVNCSVIPAGEESKTLDTVKKIYDKLNACGIGRKDLIVNIGGGVVGDVGGFAAATYMRGIPYIQVPTTLLAQIDSSIGGKTGVDLAQGKNLVGSIYQPECIVIDPLLLNTLQEKVYNDGLAEAIKYGLIADKHIFDILCCKPDKGSLMEIIRRSVKIKSDVVEQDVNESGLRMILNFGHTFGHSIEKFMNYKGIMHGEAVAIGMVIAANIGEQLGITPLGIKEAIRSVLLEHKLPVSTEIPIIALIKGIFDDKKRSADKINFVMLSEIGKAVIVKLNIDKLGEFNYE